MGLTGEYSRKHINAKYIITKVKEESDYAWILIGHNGMPVWYIIRYPKRMFKWSPEFHPFFETPIATVWCKILGLPMHFLDEAALFVIVGVLGNPIQVDEATADQSRISFARIYVEIDISEPVPKDVIIEHRGKDIVLEVKWDNIPTYCEECKHVGHSISTCYANGKQEKPVKWSYHYQSHGSTYHTHRPGRNGNNSHREDKGKGKEDIPSASYHVPADDNGYQGPHNPDGISFEESILRGTNSHNGIRRHTK